MWQRYCTNVNHKTVHDVMFKSEGGAEDVNVTRHVPTRDNSWPWHWT